MLKLILPGEPTAQARMRFFRRGNKTMCFDPQTALKRELRLLLQEQMPTQ